MVTVHLVVQRITDLSGELASVGQRGESFPLPHGRGDEVHHGSPGSDPHIRKPAEPRPRDMYVRDLHLDTIRVRPRDFR